MFHSSHTLGSFVFLLMSEDKTLKENISTGSLASLRNGSSVAARKHCSIISSNFLLLLNFIPLGISFIPLDHPQTIVLPPGCFYSFQVFGKLQILIDPLFFFSSSSANFCLQWTPVCFSLRLKILFQCNSVAGLHFLSLRS